MHAAVGIDYARIRIAAHARGANVVTSVRSVARHLDFDRRRIIIEAAHAGSLEILGAEQRAPDGIDVGVRVAPVDLSRGMPSASLAPRPSPGSGIGLLFGMKIEAVQIRLRPDDDRRKFALRQLAVAQHVPARTRPNRPGRVGTLRTCRDQARHVWRSSPCRRLPYSYGMNALPRYSAERTALRCAGSVMRGWCRRATKLPSPCARWTSRAQRESAATIDPFMRYVVAVMHSIQAAR